jgi:hypothetical protein
LLINIANITKSGCNRYYRMLVNQYDIGRRGCALMPSLYNQLSYFGNSFCML